MNTIGDRYQAADALLVYFSGNKGFHVGLSTALWNAEPTVAFNTVAKRFAAAIAEVAQIDIDMSVYDKVRAFRAPNSRHPKSNLHKIRLSVEELGFPLDEIKRLAVRPRSFSLPQVERDCDAAVRDWQVASDRVQQQAVVLTVYADARLNRLTLDFLREGAKPGERATRLFSAAANFAEFTSVNGLAHALLTEPARNSGLSPSETLRQIECGLSHRSS